MTTFASLEPSDGASAIDAICSNGASMPGTASRLAPSVTAVSSRRIRTAVYPYDPFTKPRRSGFHVRVHSGGAFDTTGLPVRLVMYSGISTRKR